MSKTNGNGHCRRVAILDSDFAYAHALYQRIFESWRVESAPFLDLKGFYAWLKREDKTPVDLFVIDVRIYKGTDAAILKQARALVERIRASGYRGPILVTGERFSLEQLRRVNNRAVPGSKRFVPPHIIKALKF